ncbi:MAG: hypothetical protein GY705_24445 [Bacteroidetes bacterium]|nr:hypothetical protein [Bacteroidota bacterium]
MNNIVLKNSIRFIGLVLFQVLILKRIVVGAPGFNYIHILVYPLFILLLPLRTPKVLVILLAFILGLTIDIFYDSIGVHASAAVFTAFLRPYILNFLEPRSGYNVNFSPTKARMGTMWFFRYSAILMVGHLFFYFSMEAFTFVYIIDILGKTFFSFLFSMIMLFILQYLFNPEE